MPQNSGGRHTTIQIQTLFEWGWGRFGDNAGHHSIHQVIIITCMYTSIQMSFLQIIKVEGI